MDRSCGKSTGRQFFFIKSVKNSVYKIKNKANDIKPKNLELTFREKKQFSLYIQTLKKPPKDFLLKVSSLWRLVATIANCSLSPAVLIDCPKFGPCRIFLPSFLF